MISTDKARCEKCKKITGVFYSGDTLWLCEQCEHEEHMTKIKEGEYIGL